MMLRRRDTRRATYETGGADGTYVEPRIRGGLSAGAILTGVVVAFGALFLLTALIGGALAAFGIDATDVSGGEALDVGIGAGIAVVVAQLISYLWGGYTAGRMGRGAGLGNGLLVPLVAVVLAVLVGAAAAALGATANLNLPFTTTRLPLEDDFLIDWGIGIGIASVAAMFVGGAAGGMFGSRWHTKLERRTIAERESGVAIGSTRRDETIDLGDRTAASERDATEEPAGRSTTEPDTTRYR